MVSSPSDEEVANSSKNHTQFKTRAQTIPYFRPKWSKLIPYWQNKKAKKTIPFGAAHTYIARLR